MPTLRELAWTAPYMHDGSLGTLDDVVRVYEMGGIARPTRSQGPARRASGSPTRSATTSSPSSRACRARRRRSPRREPWVNAAAARAPARRPRDTTVVSQSNKLFSPAHVRLGAGRTLTVLNDDTRTHNVRIYDRASTTTPAPRSRTRRVTIRFPGPGTFEAFCGIHPSMRLTIEVK